jgi:hypothetical protein
MPAAYRRNGVYAQHPAYLRGPLGLFCDAVDSLAATTRVVVDGSWAGGCSRDAGDFRSRARQPHCIAMPTLGRSSALWINTGNTGKSVSGQPKNRHSRSSLGFPQSGR